MANGDDKKIKGSSSGYTYTITDPDYQAGFRSSDFEDEKDLGGGSYSVTGTKDQTTRKAISGGTPGKDWDNWMIGELNRGVSPETLAKQGHGFSAATITKRFPGQYKPKKTTYTHNNKAQNNVTNTKPTNTGNGNIATATATGGSVGNITIGTGTGTKTTTGKQDGQKTTKQPGTPGSTLGGSNNNAGGNSSSSTTGNTRGYSGNSPFNQATATATGGSVGDITINVPGGGGGSGTPASGGGPGKISDLLGGIKPGVKQPAFKKTTGIAQGTQGGKTPYKFRGLENQFQSWQMNRYDNDTTT